MELNWFDWQAWNDFSERNEVFLFWILLLLNRREIDDFDSDKNSQLTSQLF